MLPRLVGCAIALCLVGGCGGSDESARRPGDVVKDYLAALADGDGTKACQQLTGEATRDAIDAVKKEIPEFKATDCETALTKLAKNLGEDERAALRDAKVAETTEKGDSATVKVKDAVTDTKLTKGSAGWLISSGQFGRAGVPAKETQTTAQAPPTETVTTTVTAPAPEPANPDAAEIKRQLQDAGYKVVPEQDAGDSAPAGDSLTIEIGDGATMTVYVFGSEADAQKFKEKIDPVQQQNPDQIAVQVEGTHVYVGSVEAPAKLSEKQFQQAVAAAES